MHRLLTIVMVLGVVGCGDPAGSGDNAPEKPSCDRDEVVAWLEAEHCPEGYVWGVLWQKAGENGTSFDNQHLPRGDSPTEDGWVLRDSQTCFEGAVPLGTFGVTYPPTMSHWRVEHDGFRYSYYPETEDREFRVTCRSDEDLRAISAYIPDGSFERWTWYGDADKPEHESFD